jgi:hexosaminidase
MGGFVFNDLWQGLWALRVIVMCFIQSPCDNMLRKLLIMISFVCNIGLSAQVLSNVHIIPQPREMSVAHGTFRITRETFVVTGQKELLSVADYFCKYTTDLLGLSLSARKVKSKEIDSIRKAIVLQNLNNGRVSGGYQLEVTNEGILIKGNDAAGVFYGVQTLIQLLPASWRVG